MDRKELDAINRLFDRLDRNMSSNAAILGRRNLDPDIETVDALGDLFERHRYLKNKHDFVPGEAEALLSFIDPLVVAQCCWEENRFANFPICEILNDIGAYDRFTLTKEAREQRGKPQVQALQERLDQNLAAYNTSLMGKSKQELIEESEAITITRAAYEYMRDSFDYSYGDANLLLKLDNPLYYLASRWSMSFDLSGNDDDPIEEIIEELNDPLALRRAKEEAAAALAQTGQEADQPPDETLDWGPAADPETKKLLMDRFDQNYAAYIASLAGMNKQEVIEKSMEIASVQDAYSFLKSSFDFTQAEGEHLLKMEGPLFFFAHVWIAPADWRDDVGSFTHEILRDLDNPEYLAEMSAAYPGFAAGKDEKPSLLEQLQKATQVVNQRPPQEAKPHRNPDAPNL